MRACGTTPDEIRWPEVADYRPATAFADAGEEKAASQ
jgi:hypothetical protein